MMQLSNRLRNLSLIAIVALLASVFSSCDPRVWDYDSYDDPYRTGLLGIWYLSYDQQGKIPSTSWEMDGYSFDRNGAGTYNFYDDRGEWVYINFTWRSYNLNTIEMRFEDGRIRTNYYSFDQYGYLVFGDNFNYRGYSPNRPDGIPSQNAPTKK